MKHTFRASWVMLVALPLLSIACGGAGRPGSGSDDTTSHSDAGVGDGGGGSNGDGRRDAGSDGNGDGGRESDAGGASDAGPDGGEPSAMCTNLADLPAPIRTTASASASCGGDSACGGDVDGTSWAYSHVCVDQDVVFAKMYEACPTANLNGLADVEVAGSLTFEGGVATHKATVDATGVFQAPAACHACNCKGFQEVTLYNLGLTNAFCYEDCYPDNSCRCLLDVSITVDESETYEVSGNTIALASGQTYDYCSSADGLSLTETSAGATIAGSAQLVPPAALNTPEICDGRDNDHNGQVDDEPKDCPADCNRKGVCADVTQVCASGGWVCEYASDRRELGAETKCDGLDNDCDGEVDEELTGCKEICDGFDNDNNGKVDDNLTAHDCATGRGVCSSVTATCKGVSGWQCDYDASSYRQTEALCDSSDNDCDGLIDEGCSCTTGKSKMFFLRMGATDAGIVRANLDGTSPELIIPILQYSVFDLAIDPAAEKIYWYDFGADEIRRASLDGTNIEPVWAGNTQQFAIDPGSPARGFVENATSTVRSFAFSAPTANTTIVSLASVSGMEVDPVNRHIYWSDHGGKTERTIMRANYDGTEQTGVLDAGYAPDSMAIDPVHRKIYFNDGLGVHVADLSGENEGLVVPKQAAAPSDMALDLTGGKIYITEGAADQVLRANLDGSDVEPLLSGAVADGVDSIVIYRCAP